jgi:hypothetical protein
MTLRGWGDQHRAVFQTSDGFSVTKDPVTGFFKLVAWFGSNYQWLPVISQPPKLTWPPLNYCFTNDTLSASFLA